MFGKLKNLAGSPIRGWRDQEIEPPQWTPQTALFIAPQSLAGALVPVPGMQPGQTLPGCTASISSHGQAKLTDRGRRLSKSERRRRAEACMQSRNDPRSALKAGEESLKSLVAEDDVSSRMILKKFLSQYGECDVAADGKEAVQAVKEAKQKGRGYDLVCLDLGMPVMDGQQALREIHKLDMAAGGLKPTRVIVTTAQTDIGSITNALLGRCNAYLMKPIDTTTLRNELEELGLIG
jgi:two-component system chemotaxis response regulator CheY